MSHITTDSEEYLAKLETFIADAPFKIRVEINSFPTDTVQSIPRGYVEEEDCWHKVVDTENGIVTKEILVFQIA